jgi:hypothetical protein
MKWKYQFVYKSTGGSGAQEMSFVVFADWDKVTGD